MKNQRFLTRNLDLRHEVCRYRKGMMIKMEKGFSQKRAENKAALTAYCIINAVLMLAYVIEIVKGSRTIGYFLIFAALDMLPLLVCLLYYRKNPENRLNRYFLLYGYGILYVFVLFTTVTQISYVYFIPIMVILPVYGDLKLCYITSAIACLSNVCWIAMMGVQGRLDAQTVTQAEIQVASIVLISAFLIICSRALRVINEHKVKEIDEARDATEKTLKNTLEISGRMTEYIQKLSETGKVLMESAETTELSMQEVSHGSTDTAETVQEQLIATEDIQDNVAKVDEGAKSISNGVNQTRQVVDNGKEVISALQEQVKVSAEASSLTEKELNALGAYMQKVNSIIEIINDVTRQTNLLALNASIEAARAGEAGKGFAVVASEITGLSDQTSQATKSIVELINGVDEELNKVKQATFSLLECNKRQDQLIQTTADNFVNIESETNAIYEQARELSENISSLTVSNNKIVDSIQNVSAISEEVSAHAANTLDSSIKTKEAVNQVSDIVEKLSTDAKALA